MFLGLKWKYWLLVILLTLLSTIIIFIPLIFAIIFNNIWIALISPFLFTSIISFFVILLIRTDGR